MPLPLQRPYPDSRSHSANAQPKTPATEFLRLLLSAVQADREAVADALEDLLADRFAVGVVELIGDHCREHHGGSDARTPEEFFPPDGETDWQKFLRLYPTHPSPAAPATQRAQAAFRRLPWNDAGFRPAFWAGLERWLDSRQWADGKVHNPDNWIARQLWRETPHPSPSAKPKVDEQERRRLQEDLTRHNREARERHRRDMADPEVICEILARTTKPIAAA